ncbi:MAG: hypothetical protein JKY56_03465 [Kofleriaceae bacterium]|nr:hypothetical protein [Kofleriaceae bacterium]
MRADTRRSGVAAAITALFAMALAAAVAGRGCNETEDGPTAALRVFVTTAAAGDRDALLEMLGPKSRAKLENAANKATKLVGGERRYEARDMIQPVSGGAGDISIVSMGRDGDTATMSVTDAIGNKSLVTAVYIDGSWLIELAD